jgi:Uma2 family endonuclease
MIVTQELVASEPEILAADEISPPTNLYSDEPPLETELHLRQILLLLKCLEWLWRDREDFYAAGNLTIYYSLAKRKNEDFRGPDFFVVLDTERKTRRSWTIWEEDGKYPNLILEILSPSTANIDRTLKKELYQNTFRTPDYFWFDPESQEFVGFHLVDGRYEELVANDRGHLWSKQLGLYLGVDGGLVRFFTSEGHLVPTPEETAEQEMLRAEQEMLRAEQESLRAERETQRADKLAAKLRELNIDPDTL